MGRTIAMFKPGEKAPAAGAYYCCVCSLRGEASTCEMKEGQRFLACPKCVERNVSEWDLVWKAETGRSSKRTGPWPGSLAQR